MASQREGDSGGLFQGKVPPVGQRLSLCCPLPPTNPTRRLSQTQRTRASDRPGDNRAPCAPGVETECGFHSCLPAPGSHRPSPRSLGPRTAAPYLPRPGAPICRRHAEPPRPGLRAPPPRGRRAGRGRRGGRHGRRGAPLPAAPTPGQTLRCALGWWRSAGAARRGCGRLRARRGPGPARAAAARLRPQPPPAPAPRAPGGGADPGGSGREAPAAEGGARRGWAARRRSPVRRGAVPRLPGEGGQGRPASGGTNRDAPRPPPRRARPRAPPRRAARRPAGDAEQPRGMRRPRPLAPLRVCAAPLARLPRGPPPWRPGGSRSSR